MANEYNIISDEALDALCGAIKGIANAGEIVDDTGVAMDKTYSSFKIQEELDKKIEGDNVVKKDDIATVLDGTVTDEQVAGAKVVYDKLIANKKIINYPYSSTKITMQEACDNNDIIKSGISIFYVGAIISDAPALYGTMIFCKEWRYSAFIIDGFTGCTYSAIIEGSGAGPFTFKGWKKVCTTNVADVKETKIEIDESALGLTLNKNYSSYKVINGICYVTIELHIKAPSNDKLYGYDKINTTTLPKIGIATKGVLNMVEICNTISLVLDKGSTDIKLHGKIPSKEGSYALQGSFSYPVAE